MTNPKNRRTAPGRERSADQRSGTFKPGHEKRGGRKRGTPNAFSAAFKKALVEAADRVGMYGNGEQGLTGYLRWVARYHARTFMRGLTSVLRRELLQGDSAEEPRPILEEIDEQIREYIARASKAQSKSPWGWTVQDFSSAS